MSRPFQPPFSSCNSLRGMNFDGVEIHDASKKLVAYIPGHEGPRVWETQKAGRDIVDLLNLHTVAMVPAQIEAKLKFRIVERPSVMAVATARFLFEKAMTETPKFRELVDLSPEIANGEFNGYLDEETNVFWVGFALGLRTAELCGWEGVIQ